MATDQPGFYEIRVEGLLAEGWSNWFEGLAITSGANNETSLSGWLSDQAALFGVLARIQALNLTLVAVKKSAPQA